MRQLVVEARSADGGTYESRSPGDLFYSLQKSTNPHIGTSSRDFSGGARTARDICLQKSTKIYMRTCARGFRRGRPSARYKAARNGPAPEKERHFRAFSLPRFRPFSGPVLRSVRPRSDRCLDRASDSGPFPACVPPDPDSVRRHPTDCRSRFPAVWLPRRRSWDARSDRILDSTATALSAGSGMPDPDLRLDPRFDARLKRRRSGQAEIRPEQEEAFPPIECLMRIRALRGEVYFKKPSGAIGNISMRF